MDSFVVSTLINLNKRKSLNNLKILTIRKSRGSLSNVLFVPENKDTSFEIGIDVRKSSQNHPLKYREAIRYQYDQQLDNSKGKKKRERKKRFLYSRSTLESSIRYPLSIIPVRKLITTSIRKKTSTSTFHTSPKLPSSGSISKQTR